MVAWTLVFHIIGLVFWLGSLLVVTQILAIHTEETTPEMHVTLGRLESKLLEGFAHPGAALMVITGFLLVSHDPNYLREHWFHAKLLLVVILVALDLVVTFRARAFQEGKIELSRRECMALHGAISLVFFAILILVLIKPFGLPRRHAQLRGTGDPITMVCLRHAGQWSVAILPISEALLQKQEGL
ncbi:MAG: CopD family protein [Terriglobia bacterium]|jgi:putative membrane protein